MRELKSILTQIRTTVLIIEVPPFRLFPAERGWRREGEIDFIVIPRWKSAPAPNFFTGRSSCTRRVHLNPSSIHALVSHFFPLLLYLVGFFPLQPPLVLIGNTSSVLHPLHIQYAAILLPFPSHWTHIWSAWRGPSFSPRSGSKFEH
jgi:hypothetical protein